MKIIVKQIHKYKEVTFYLFFANMLTLYFSRDIVEMSIHNILEAFVVKQSLNHKEEEAEKY